MEVNFNHTDRIAEVWLTNAEQQNPQTQIALKSLAKEYKAKRYTVAVFRSGKGDLEGATAGLLLHNKK